MVKARTALIATAIGACATVGVSCGRSESTLTHSDAGSVAAAASPSSSAAVAHGVPLPAEQIAKVVNPGNLPVYTGSTGTVRGVVTVTGDRAPDQPQVLAKIPPKCAAAAQMYGKLFREGENRTLADVLVAVTGYGAYVPAREAVHRVEARNCSWGTRTIAIVFGQRIEVFNKDREPYLPDLYGGSMPAQIVALPGGDPVQIYPTKPPRYTLADTLHPFIKADVFVVKYPTTAVTELDGKYEISGVPIGDLTVSAVLPVTMQTASKDVKVVADQAVEVNLEIPYPGQTAPGASAATAGSGAAPTSAASARAGANAKPKAPVRAATPH